MTAVIATTSERYAQFVGNLIRQRRPLVKIEHLSGQEGFAKALSEIKPAMLLVESGFFEAATVYEIRRLASRRHRMKIGVVNFGELSEKEKENLYCAGALAVIDFREGEKKVLESLDGFLFEAAHHYENGGNITGGAEITNREMEILLLSCEGKNNEDIGGLLGISAGVVKNYKSSIYEKCGVENCVQLIRFAVTMGWYVIRPFGNSRVRGGFRNAAAV